jgi:Pyridoxamine 5'-phosphate oxidase
MGETDETDEIDETDETHDRADSTDSTESGDSSGDSNGTVPFAEMERQAPDLARHARDRFDATGLCLVGTLRSDGWPRISPVEPLLHEGQLYLGMMPASTKSRDLTRDPRCLVHSTISDKDGTEGEVKLYGLARRILDEDEIERYCVALEAAIGWRPKGPADFDLWVVDLTRASYQRFGGNEHHFGVWESGSALRTVTRPAPG